MPEITKHKKEKIEITTDELAQMFIDMSEGEIISFLGSIAHHEKRNVTFDNIGEKFQKALKVCTQNIDGFKRLGDSEMDIIKGIFIPNYMTLHEATFNIGLAPTETNISDRCEIESLSSKSPLDNVTVESLLSALRVCKIRIPSELVDLLIDLCELIEIEEGSVKLEDIQKLYSNHIQSLNRMETVKDDMHIKGLKRE